MNRQPNFDPDVASSARIWDYLRCGKDHLEIDRDIADQMLMLAPDARTVAWFVQAFQRQTTRSAVDAGIAQFIDLGPGIPPDRSETVAAIARAVIPSARVAYIDNDPVPVVHYDAWHANKPGLTALQADIRDPHGLIEALKADETIDFTEPIALSALNVLDYVLDEEDPAAVLAAFREVMAPGSRLTITHSSITSDPDLIARYHADTVNTPAQAVFRSSAEIATLTAGFDLTSPGLVPVQQLLGDDLPVTRMVVLGAEYTLAAGKSTPTQSSSRQCTPANAA
ncbi:SAM-dependent methyltransferase [Nocardia brasiliensis]|uniref:SAM-dependent methyltransferase n=1 Tax=Nocardia brasiliensis TaxID=37326 RepID=UPI0033ED64EB